MTKPNHNLIFAYTIIIVPVSVQVIFSGTSRVPALFATGSIWLLLLLLLLLLSFGVVVAVVLVVVVLSLLLAVPPSSPLPLLCSVLLSAAASRHHHGTDLRLYRGYSFPFGMC